MSVINSSPLKINKSLVIIILVILIGSISSFIYLKPFLDFKDTMFLRLDWHIHFQIRAATWVTLVKYHEFPFWNPYLAGGNFLHAHPVSLVFSPETLMTLIFGPIKGLYYSVLFFYVLSFFGCYLVGRQLKLSFLGTLYLAVVFTFSSYVMNNLFMGATIWIPFGYIPLTFYFLMKSQEDWRYGAAAGFFHALIYLDGGIYIYMLFIVFAALYIASAMIDDRNFKYAKGLAAMLVFSLLIASIKILPSLDLYELNKREVGFEKIPFGLDLMKKAFLDKQQAWDIVSAYTYKGHNFHYPSYGSYIGVIPIIIAVIGIVLFAKKLKFVLPLFGSLLLYLSNFGPFTFIWDIMRLIPPFTTLQRPARFIIFFTLMLAIVGAIVISWVDKLKIRNWKYGEYIKKAALAGLIIFLFIDLTKSSYLIIDNFKPWPMSKDMIKWDDKFEYYDFYDRLNLSKEQIAYLDANYFKAFGHFDTLSNKGFVKRYYDPMPISYNKSIIRTKSDQDYRGEYYFKNIRVGDNVQVDKWSPNKVTLKAVTGTDNLLIVNQYYHKLWKTKEGFEIINYNGLVGIKVPKGVYTIHLYVFQDKIFIGAFLSVVGLLLGVYLLRDIYKKPPK